MKTFEEIFTPYTAAELKSFVPFAKAYAKKNRKEVLEFIWWSGVIVWSIAQIIYTVMSQLKG